MEPSPRVVNGVKTSGNDYPWIVSIQWTTTRDDLSAAGIHAGARNVACTGTLIRSEYPAAVLTAGHCTSNGILTSESEYTYYADIGRTYPYDDNINDTFQTLEAFFYYTSSASDGGSNPNTLTDYDIGIILLNGEVTNIEPIELYNPDNALHVDVCCSEGQILRAMGYGYIEEYNAEGFNYPETLWTDTLRYIDMEYTNDIQNCSDEIIQCIEDKTSDATDEPIDTVVDDGSAFCAQIDDGCVCQGDSGGPIVYIDDVSGDILEIGIVSQSCCIIGVPNMFASVGFFHDLIQHSLDDDTWIMYAPTTTESENESDSFMIVPCFVIYFVGLMF